MGRPCMGARSPAEESLFRNHHLPRMNGLPCELYEAAAFARLAGHRLPSDGVGGYGGSPRRERWQNSLKRWVDAEPIFRLSRLCAPGGARLVNVKWMSTSGCYWSSCAHRPSHARTLQDFFLDADGIRGNSSGFLRLIATQVGRGATS